MHIVYGIFYFFKVGTFCDNLILPNTATVKIYSQEQKVGRLIWLQV